MGRIKFPAQIATNIWYWMFGRLNLTPTLWGGDSVVYFLSHHLFQMFLSYFVTFTSPCVNVTSQPASHSGEIPTSEFRCSPGSMYAALAPSGIFPMSNSQACVLGRAQFPSVPNNMVFFVVLILWIGADGFRYIVVDTESEMLELSLLTIFDCRIVRMDFCCIISNQNYTLMQALRYFFCLVSNTCFCYFRPWYSPG